MSTPSMPIDGSSLSDEELVQRMTRGDENALRTLVQRQGARLAFLARRILGASATEEDVEEVVSDTFLHAWNTSEAYDPERALVRTWLGWLLIARGLPKRRSLLRLQRLHEAVTQRAASEITIDDIRTIRSKSVLMPTHNFSLRSSCSEKRLQLTPSFSLAGTSSSKPLPK
jgi:hypothetical protein